MLVNGLETPFTVLKKEEGAFPLRGNSAAADSDVLVLETSIVKVKGPMGVGYGVASVNGKAAAEAELTFALG